MSRKNFIDRVDSILENGHWQLYKGNASFIADQSSVKRFVKKMGLKGKRHKNVR